MASSSPVDNVTTGVGYLLWFRKKMRVGALVCPRKINYVTGVAISRSFWKFWSQFKKCLERYCLNHKDYNFLDCDWFNLLSFIGELIIGQFVIGQSFKVVVWGNSLVLHCASLLRTIFASLARSHERVHVQNVRDFPQTKLDREINSPFLLNEHDDPRFFFRYLLRIV